MSILIAIIPSEGKLQKADLELATYGAKAASNLGTDAKAVVLGACDDASSLGKYGVKEVHVCEDPALNSFDSQVFSAGIADAASKTGSNIVVLRANANGKSLGGRLAIKMDAGIVSGANALPTSDNGFSVQKSVYSGKAIGTFAINTQNKIVTLTGNSVQPEEVADALSTSSIALDLPTPKVKLKERKVVSGIVPLPEAELVVSAGRGMKEPGNWGIIEELADVLGATTACSRPVADIGWRPHHEHVGQTGVAIRPNLYIAAGISGAIQHLAGVNNSKVIVVINKDPEAPFFKAADYGVVGDLFDVVPRLTEALKKAKAS